MAAANSSFFILHSSFPENTDTVVPKARWKVQKTAPVEVADLDSSALDLHFPENIKRQVEYNDSLNVYVLGSKMGDSYLNTPVLMTPEEYRQWSERKERERFFRPICTSTSVLPRRFSVLVVCASRRRVLPN